MSNAIRWTLADIPDQKGRRVIVTGANSGLGYHTALELARKGADVTMAIRNRKKGEEAVLKMRSSAPKAKIRIEELDVSSLKSVRAFAERELKAGKPLDLLVNNAGIMAVPVRMETEDGFELQMGTNHMGHFALTGLLWPLLLQGNETRVVSVASVAHNFGKMRFHDLDCKKFYHPWAAYGQSKLANLLFGRELHARCTAKGINIKSVIAHPGLSDTNLIQTGGTTGAAAGLQTRIMQWGSPLVTQSAERGALPSLYAASAEDAESGVYYGPSGLMEFVGKNPRRARLAPQGRNAESAAKLWEVSEQLTGVSFA